MKNKSAYKEIFENNEILIEKISDWIIYCKFPEKCETEEKFKKMFVLYKKVKNKIIQEEITFKYGLSFITPEGKGCLIKDNRMWQTIVIENKDDVFDYYENNEIYFGIEFEEEEFKEPLLIITLNHDLQVLKHMIIEKSKWTGKVSSNDFLEIGDYEQMIFWLFNEKLL